MQCFKDQDGNDWRISLDFDKVEEIAARVERPGSTPENRKYYDLMNLTNEEMVNALQIRDLKNTFTYSLEHIRCIVNLLYCFCENQCKERGITQEAFAKRLHGQTLGDAYAAMMEEIVNFIPSPDDRETARMMTTALDRHAKAVLSETTQIFQETMSAVNARTTSEMKKIGDELRKSVADVPVTVKPAT